MKCKLMDIIGGNKKYFILAICLIAGQLRENSKN